MYCYGLEIYSPAEYFRQNAPGGNIIIIDFGFIFKIGGKYGFTGPEKFDYCMYSSKKNWVFFFQFWMQKYFNV